MMTHLDTIVNPTTTDDGMSMSFSAKSLFNSNNAKSTPYPSSKPDSDTNQGKTIVVPNKPPPASVQAGDTPHPSLKTAQNDQSGQQGPPRCVYGALS